MKYGGLRKYLQILHKDKMSITRPEPQVQADGSTCMIIPDTPKYKDIPCRISFLNNGSDSSNSQTDTNNPINELIKIFCDPKTDVKKGDQLTIQRYNEDGEVIETYTGMTGNKPAIYNMNMEILFTQVGDA